MSKWVGDYGFNSLKRENLRAVDRNGSRRARKNDKTLEFGDTIALQTNFIRTRLNIFIGAF